MGSKSNPKGGVKPKIGFVDLEFLLKKRAGIFQGVFKAPFRPLPIEEIEREVEIRLREAVVGQETSSRGREIGALRRGASIDRRAGTLSEKGGGEKS